MQNESAAFQEWVWDTLDCWKGNTKHGDAYVQATIRSLIELPKPPRVRKAHPLDGLVTWDDNDGVYGATAQTGKLTPGFQYRASIIWRSKMPSSTLPDPLEAFVFDGVRCDKHFFLDSF